ncbi:hypothetical protein M409DRAFT_26570 [Zasmidium cellare ATCC 36951]|uniref:Tautomerase cis-CaaD-like domain-containing protein n=1 Tax=Zasmidium cellare ATCC 36951 TaxID=1080233 RepID=A0A6A6C7V8_ZASCE|nr:uncharacterized protein M409DRAFT_26570 [Zasmidium cellare ATCC 36951]KAF2163125.1 hypothetical protein M409DRAFT_26570 [Zasmidium cellare ATCC 36951]
MPRYEIDHAIPLSASQQDDLAQEITRLHLAAFRLVPKFFVNIIFTDLSHKTCYVSGRKRKTNHIKGQLRQGNRDRSDFQKLANDIKEAWGRIVVDRAEGNRKNYAIQTVVLIPSNQVAVEAGFPVPLVGEEHAWYKDHAAKFEQLANAGDEDSRELVQDMHENGLG